ncbi:MAG: hypothetical protein BWY72_02556 [Bacteroidetes bacterium ADurb.Bin416]|nr:MAG: hypothetical protein BWY72_02556 [Bacteroidetes bacterium ADurb.Bin416]
MRVPDATGSYTLKMKAVALASSQTQCNTLFNDLNTHVMRSIPQQVAVGTGALTLEVDTTGVFNDFGEKDKTLSVTTDAGSAVTASVTTKGVRLAFTGSTILAGASSKTFKVTVKAADAPHADAVTTFSVMVRASNSPPVATTKKLTINYISQGGKLTIQPTGLFTDPENDSMTYRIETSSSKVLIDGMVVQGIKDSSGIIPIQVIATDVCGASTSRTFDITLREPVVKPDAILSGFGYAQTQDWRHVLSTARHGTVQVRNLQGQILFSAPAPVSPQQVLQALGDSPAIVQLGRSYWRLHKTQP